MKGQHEKCRQCPAVQPDLDNGVVLVSVATDAERSRMPTRRTRRNTPATSTPALIHVIGPKASPHALAIVCGMMPAIKILCLAFKNIQVINTLKAMPPITKIGIDIVDCGTPDIINAGACQIIHIVPRIRAADSGFIRSSMRGKRKPRQPSSSPKGPSAISGKEISPKPRQTGRV